MLLADEIPIPVISAFGDGAPAMFVVRFEDGRITSRAWEDYPILRFSGVPEITVTLIDAAGEPSLGLGEVAHDPVAAAVGNAVAHALGGRPRHMPFTRECVIEALLGDD